jgi:diacylglycerol kinase
MRIFAKSVGFAIEGLVSLYKSERNARIHTGIAIVVLSLALLLHVTAVEFCLLVLMFGMVLSMEAANTAVEKICDMYTKEIDPRVKVIKDLGAGAVLMAGIAAITVGLVLLIPYIIRLFQ